jgi:hypothetical protein
MMKVPPKPLLKSLISGQYMVTLFRFEEYTVALFRFNFIEVTLFRFNE